MNLSELIAKLGDRFDFLTRHKSDRDGSVRWLASTPSKYWPSDSKAPLYDFQGVGLTPEEAVQDLLNKHS